MAIELTAVVVRGERRLRLVYSAPVAAGAFATPAPAYFVVENVDGKAPDPVPVESILVAGAPANVELALQEALVPGALYRVTTIGVPAQDSSVSTGASVEAFRVGVAARPINAEPKVNDADLLLYGRDIVFDGNDYAENAEGDLEIVDGLPNARAAVERRLLGSPLPYAPDYSPRARSFVDGPSPAIAGLAGALQREALRDDRVAAVSVKLVLADADSYFEVSPTFVGGKSLSPVSVSTSRST